MRHYVPFLLITAALFSSGAGATQIQFDAATPVNHKFLGFGYNIDLQADYDNDVWHEVIAKRLTEVNRDGFTRARGWGSQDFHPNQNSPNFNQPEAYRFLDLLKRIDNDVLIDARFNQNPSWLGDGYAKFNQADINRYAQSTQLGLAHLVHTKGYDNVTWWAISNELAARPTGGSESANNWWGRAGSEFDTRISNYLDYIKAVEQQLHHNADPSKRVDVKILGGDTISAGNTPHRVFDAIRSDAAGRAAVDGYGYHDYPQGSSRDGYFWWGATRYDNENENDWDDPRFYHTALERMHAAKHQFAEANKPLIIGEFGSPSESTDRPPVNARIGIDDERAALYHVDRMIAGLNAGVDAMMMWELHDQLGSYWYRKHGLFAGERDDWDTRPVYFAAGMLSKFVRKNSTVFQTTSPNELLHAAAVRNNDDGTLTFVLVNRSESDTVTDLRLVGDAAGDTAFRRYVIDPTVTPDTRFGDLPGPDGKQSLVDGMLEDVHIPAGAMVIFTSDFDELAPGLVENKQVSKISGGVRVTWDASDADDLAYYRVYATPFEDLTEPSLAYQIGSTVDTRLTFAGGSLGQHYWVTAVDIYGNESAIVAVPEPATGMLLALGACALLRRRQ